MKVKGECMAGLDGVIELDDLNVGLRMELDGINGKSRVGFSYVEF